MIENVTWITSSACSASCIRFAFCYSSSSFRPFFLFSLPLGIHKFHVSAQPCTIELLSTIFHSRLSFSHLIVVHSTYCASLRKIFSGQGENLWQLFWWTSLFSKKVCAVFIVQSIKFWFKLEDLDRWYYKVGFELSQVGLY